MTDLIIRIEQTTARVTLNRPDALNALTHGMVLEMTSLLAKWKSEDAVSQIIIDAAGERAFCAGGDIQDLYDRGTNRDFAFGAKFWRDEYALNAMLAHYPKPIIVLMQGFTMGGGVGVACHASHRIVGDTCSVAMPECGIGLVPDVGGSAILSCAPGRLGDYLATTGYRMNAQDAILAGFADTYIPEDKWSELAGELIKAGNPEPVDAFGKKPPPGGLDQETLALIDGIFTTTDAATLVRNLENHDSEFAAKTLKTLQRQSPISVWVILGILERLKKLGGGVKDRLESALALEYHFTSQSSEHADFLEGIRAAVIDKDRKPEWKHKSIGAVPENDVTALLATEY